MPAVTTRVVALRAHTRAVEVLDQRELPARTTHLVLSTPEDVAHAIRTLTVRGAPLIGAAAYYGVWLGALSTTEGTSAAQDEAVQRAASLIRASRPTAVNLFHAVDAALRVWGGARGTPHERAAALRAAAEAWAHDDERACAAMALNGAALLPAEGGVLTHCNTGALATCGVGTAAGVIRAALAMGKKLTVYADETRPLLQGARLTAWELMQDGIPVVLLPDGAAAGLIRSGRIQAAITGADRIARNGDTANKVGTYGVALACHAHHVPFYIAAPWTTVDLNCATGADIPIEERHPSEVTHVQDVRMAPEGVAVFNPSFDVTPAHLIRGIITERGVFAPPHLAFQG